MILINGIFHFGLCLYIGGTHTGITVPWHNHRITFSFIDFLNFLFLQLRKTFFLSRILLGYHKTHFPGQYCLKKKTKKIAHFGPKLWTNPFEKSQFFDFLNFLFFKPKKPFLHSRISQNTFSWPILPYKKTWKIANFSWKPWTNPFEKISIFRLFELLVFKA